MGEAESAPAPALAPGAPNRSDPMLALLDVVQIALQLFVYLVVASAIMSWLVAFNVVNMRNDFVRAIGNFLYQVTEPVLRPIRRVLPQMGGLDLSPIVLLLGVVFLQSLIGNYIRPAVIGAGL